MWWIIGAIALVLLVIAGVVSKQNAFKREQEARRRREAQLTDIRAKLKPRVRFRAHGSYGNIIKGEVIKVIDANRIEAWCKVEGHQQGETGPFPIDNIFEILE